RPFAPKKRNTFRKQAINPVVSQNHSIERIMPNLLPWCTSQGLDLGLGNREALLTEVYSLLSEDPADPTQTLQEVDREVRKYLCGIGDVAYRVVSERVLLEESQSSQLRFVEYMLKANNFVYETLDPAPSGALRGELVMSVFAFHLTWTGYTPPSNTGYPSAALALSLVAVFYALTTWSALLQKRPDPTRVREADSSMLVLPDDWNSGTSAQKYLDKVLKLPDEKWKHIYRLSGKKASNISNGGPLCADDDDDPDSICLSD
ncbi:hypothetical protein BDP27DRAFT_1353209, partial [Rhodocollybia butyracea]